MYNIKAIGILIAIFFSMNLDAQSNRRAPKGKSVRLTTDLPVLDVSIDGVLITRLRAGKYSTIEVDPPVANLQLSSNGYLSRNAILFVQGNQKLEHFSLTLPKYNGKSEKTFEPPSPESFYAIRRLPSICSRYSEGEPAFGTGLCYVRSIIDEFRVILPPPDSSRFNTLKGPARTIALQLYNQRYEYDSPGTLEDSEKLYAMTKASKMSLELNGIVNFFNNKCPRVAEMAYEARTLGITSNLLAILQSGCFEMQKNFRLAIQRLKMVIKRNSSQLEKSVAFYHLARNLLPENPKNSARVAANCSKKNPLFGPCVNTHLYLLRQNKNFKAYKNTLETYTSRLEKFIAADVNKVFTFLKQARDQEALRAAEMIENKIGPNFLCSWVKIVIYDRAKDKRNLYREQKKSQILIPYARKSLKNLFPYVKALSDQRHRLEFLTKLTNIHTRNILFVWELSRYYEETKQCTKINGLIDRLSKVTRTKKGPLYDIGGRCFMKLAAFKEATYHFKELTLAKPNDWRSFFNLADALERQGQLNEAKRNFEIAIRLNPPAEFLDKIRRKTASIP